MSLHPRRPLLAGREGGPADEHEPGTNALGKISRQGETYPPETARDEVDAALA